MNQYTPNDLRIVEALSEVPENELQWLLDHSECRSYEKGEFVFQRGDAGDHMYILMKGRILFYFEQNGERRDFGEAERGALTGLLPYSRMTTAGGNAAVIEDVDVIIVGREAIDLMITACHNLTTALVHLMTTRVRDFTSSQQQLDKLAALGKLSAGLAHELNNPASAIVRSADVLKQHLGHVPDRFKKVLSMRMEKSAINVVNGLADQKILEGIKDIPMLERSDLEDDLLDWLEDHDIDFSEEWVEQLLDFNFSTDDLETICSATGAEALGPSLGWLVNVLTTEKLVEEIKDDLSSTMSQYLIDQINSIDNIEVSGQTEICRAEGTDRLEKVVLKDRISQSETELDATALFIFIGAKPYTEWLNNDYLRDPKGFLLSGRDLTSHPEYQKRWKLDRDPYILETSVPGVFTAGDVRSGAMNRVASAVGEGAMRISLVHRYLSEN